MSAVCSDGGRITGPHLKEMSRLTHTEYVLRGRSRLDPRDILRETMFAPTVTGSPMQNACTVITRHETHPARVLLRRRGAVHAAHRRDPRRRVHARPRCADPHPHRLPRTTAGCAYRSARLSCATPTRTARSARRTARPPACSARSARSPATVRRSRLRRCRPTRSTRMPRPPSARPLADDPDIATLLASRNARLASFWLNPQDALAAGGPFEGRSAIVVDAEDRFTTMLAHQLRHLGLDVEIVPWSDVTDEQIDGAELIVSGPGPGDPRDPSTPRMRRMREVVARRRASGRPLLAVCLSHQILAAHVRHRAGTAGCAAPGTAEDGRRVRRCRHPSASTTRSPRACPPARRSSARRRSRPIRSRATSTRCAVRGSPRCRGTSSRSCRATG